MSTKKILIVEDDKNLLGAVADIFRKMGAEVLTAESAAGARLVYRQYRDTIGLVISDCNLETRLSGAELLKEIRAGNPDIQLAFHSGEPDLDAIAQGLVNVTVLKKPAGKEHLEGLIYDMERGPRPAKALPEPPKVEPKPAITKRSGIRSWFHW